MNFIKSKCLEERLKIFSGKIMSVQISLVCKTKGQRKLSKKDHNVFIHFKAWGREVSVIEQKPKVQINSANPGTKNTFHLPCSHSPATIKLLLVGKVLGVGIVSGPVCECCRQSTMKSIKHMTSFSSTLLHLQFSKECEIQLCPFLLSRTCF